MKPSHSLLSHFSKECQALEEKGLPNLVLHQDSIILATNKMAAASVNYNHDDILGLNAWRMFDPSSFQVIQENLQRHNDSSYDAMLITQSGQRHKVHLEVLQLMHNEESVRLVGFKIL